MRGWTCLLIATLLSACATARHRTVAQTNPTRVSVLTYNVENLFDTEDDPEKLDDTFLPAAAKYDEIFRNKCRVTNNSPGRVAECLTKNWSPAVVNRKLRRLTDVVSQVGSGTGPDVLIVEEVENDIILDKWREEHLSHMAYKTLAYVRGPDERGINPAILSRLPMVGQPKLHEIDFSEIDEKARPSRGILEAHLQLPNGEMLAVFAIHFPAQGAPTEFRRVAADRLIQVTSALPAGTNVLVGGDFNITAREEVDQKYFREKLSKHFAVSHLVGCDQCVGTTYFPPDKTWSFFDALLFSKNLVQSESTWRLDAKSIQVVNSSIYQVNRFGSPARFGTGKGAVGVSDHWPVYAELHLTPAQPVGVTP